MDSGSDSDVYSIFLFFFSFGFLLHSAFGIVVTVLKYSFSKSWPLMHIMACIIYTQDTVKLLSWICYDWGIALSSGMVLAAERDLRS